MDPDALARELIASPTRERDARLAGIACAAAARRLGWALHAVCAAGWRQDPARVQDAVDCIALLALLHHDTELAAVRDWLDGIAALGQGETARACRLLKRSAATFMLLDGHADAARAMSHLADCVALRHARMRQAAPAR